MLLKGGSSCSSFPSFCCAVCCLALPSPFFFFFNPSSPSPPFDLLLFGHLMIRPCSPFRFDSFFSLLSLYSHFHVPQSQSQSLAQLIYYVMSSYPLFCPLFFFFFIFISRFPHPILLLMSLIITWSLLLTQTGAYGIFFYFPFLFNLELSFLSFPFLFYPRMRSMELTC